MKVFFSADITRGGHSNTIRQNFMNILKKFLIHANIKEFNSIDYLFKNKTVTLKVLSTIL